MHDGGDVPADDPDEVRRARTLDPGQPRRLARGRLPHTVEPIRAGLALDELVPGARNPFRITGTAAGQRVRVRVDRPPPCVHQHARSRLSLTTRPRSGDGLPARMLADVPPPFSPSAIRTTNGWQVSNGRTLVDVYAGEAGNDASIGMFGILRQDLEIGWQTRRLVAVGHTGAIRITQAPLGAGVETSAQRADVEFSSPSGAHGVLHLANDTAELLP